jgi:hypothetical protein
MQRGRAGIGGAGTFRQMARTDINSNGPILAVATISAIAYHVCCLVLGDSQPQEHENGLVEPQNILVVKPADARAKWCGGVALRAHAVR